MIKNNKIKIECPNCKKIALSITRPSSVCDSCGKKYKWHELQNKWHKSVISSKNGSLDKSGVIFESCVNCGSRSMIFYKKLDIWICFNCGTGWEKHEVSKCEACQLYSDDLIGQLCSECWNEGLGVLVNSSNTAEMHQIGR